MKRLLILTFLASLLSLGSGQDLEAQDLVITNARIIDGNGGTMEQGSVVVRNGRIASVSAGDTAAPGLMEIDAQGMTLMPGFIDAHRHIMRGDAEIAGIEHVKGRGYHGIKRRFATATRGMVGRDKQAGTLEGTLENHYVQDDRDPKKAVAEALAEMVDG